MISLEEMLTAQYSLTVDIYRVIGDGNIGISRIEEARIEMDNQYLYIDGLPALSRSLLQIEPSYFKYLSIRSRQLPEIVKIIIY